MTRHIESIYIDSFRGIRKLEMTDLGLVNVIVGKNNCGKTSVMEVIRGLKSINDMTYWRSLRKTPRAPFRTISAYESIASLFNEENNTCSFDVVFKDNAKFNIQLFYDISHVELLPTEVRELTGYMYRDPEESTCEDMEPEVHQMLDFQVFIDKKIALKDNVYDVQNRFKLSEARFENDIELANVVYISPTKHTENIVFLNRIFDNPDLYEEMLEVLREFDDGIISINVDNSNSKYRVGNVYKILSKNHTRALPLDVYGDGFKKALLFMSSLLVAQNGILLVDEFETALHTTAMDKVFSWILKSAKKLNVQLFLTTHSEEALDNILKCCPEIKEEIRVVTLYNNNHIGKTVSRVLNAEDSVELKDVLGVDLR